MAKTRVVAIADLHSGSRVAVADPADWPRKDPDAEVRRKLWDIWLQCAKDSYWNQPDVLILNGDLVEGQNTKHGGSGNLTNDLEEQAEMAIGLIRMWGAKHIYVVRGSPYHVEAGHSSLQVEEFIAKRLGAVPYPGQDDIPEESRRRSGLRLKLTVQDVTFHVMHKIGISRVFHYKSTPTARDMLFVKLHEDVDEIKSKIILRAHGHYYVMVGFAGAKGFQLPCWKALDDFLAASTGIVPHYGFLGFTIEGDHYDYQEKLWSDREAQSTPHIIMPRQHARKPGGSSPRTRKVSRRRNTVS